MRQLVINTDESLRLNDQPVSLTHHQRLDTPHLDTPHLETPHLETPHLETPQITTEHWFFAQFVGLDHESELHTEKPSMSWRSKLSWYCDPRKWIRTIVHLPDTPHSIALGTSIGVFIGLTPTFGIQMLLVLAVAFAAKPFFRFNQFAALVGVYISNPFTMLPIYWFNYRLGTLFIHSEISWEEFVRLFHYSSYSEWFYTIVNVFYTLGAPLVIGSLLVATVISLPTYPAMLRVVEGVQARRKLRKNKRSHQELAAPNKSEVADQDSLAVPYHENT